MCRDTDIAIKKGDIVIVLDTSRKAKWKGLVKEKQGFFPPWVVVEPVAPDSGITPGAQDNVDIRRREDKPQSVDNRTATTSQSQPHLEPSSHVLAGTTGAATGTDGQEKVNRQDKQQSVDDSTATPSPQSKGQPDLDPSSQELAAGATDAPHSGTDTGIQAQEHVKTHKQEGELQSVDNRAAASPRARPFSGELAAGATAAVSTSGNATRIEMQDVFDTHKRDDKQQLVDYSRGTPSSKGKGQSDLEPSSHKLAAGAIAARDSDNGTGIEVQDNVTTHKREGKVDDNRESEPSQIIGQSHLETSSRKLAASVAAVSASGSITRTEVQDVFDIHKREDKQQSVDDSRRTPCRQSKGQFDLEPFSHKLPAGLTATYALGDATGIKLQDNVEKHNRKAKEQLVDDNTAAPSLNKGQSHLDTSSQGLAAHTTAVSYSDNATGRKVQDNDDSHRREDKMLSVDGNTTTASQSKCQPDLEPAFHELAASATAETEIGCTVAKAEIQNNTDTHKQNDLTNVGDDNVAIVHSQSKGQSHFQPSFHDLATGVTNQPDSKSTAPGTELHDNTDNHKGEVSGDGNTAIEFSQSKHLSDLELASQGLAASATAESVPRKDNGGPQASSNDMKHMSEITGNSSNDIAASDGPESQTLQLKVHTALQISVFCVH